MWSGFGSGQWAEAGRVLRHLIERGKKNVVCLHSTVNRTMIINNLICVDPEEIRIILLETGRKGILVREDRNLRRTISCSFVGNRTYK